MGVGLETDMETGRPLEMEALSRDARRDELRAQELERHQRLLSDLSGQGGEILKDIAERLASRIEELIARDAEASLLMRLLDGVEQKLIVGERMAQDALAKVFSREGLTSPLE